MIIEKEYFEETNETFYDFYSYGDDATHLYGVDFVTITDEDIRKLKQGKIASFHPQDEYTVFFRYKEA